MTDEVMIIPDDVAEEVQGSEDHGPFMIPSGISVELPWSSDFSANFKQLLLHLLPEDPPQDTPAGNILGNIFGRAQSDPLALVIQRLEARVGRGSISADRKNSEFSDFLQDDEQEQESEVESEFADVDISHFVAFDALKFLLSAVDAKAEAEAVEAVGGGEEEWTRLFGERPRWSALMDKMDDTRRRVAISEVVQQLEDALYIAGSTRPRKFQLLRGVCQAVRRLLPKTPKFVQNFWRRALAVLVEEAPEPAEVRAEALAAAWEEAAVGNQRDEIFRLRQDLVATLAPDLLTEVVTAFHRREVFSLRRFEVQTAAVTRLFDLWRREEECLGRFYPPPPTPRGRKPSQQEKRFAAHLLDLFFPIDSSSAVDATAAALEPSSAALEGAEEEEGDGGAKERELGGAMLLLTRTSLFGGRAGTSEEEEETRVTLPNKVYLVRRGNELLECRLTEVAGLDRQSVAVAEKDWEGGREFGSLAEVFDSYEQRFVKMQDRTTLANPADALRYFAVRAADGAAPAKHITLHEAIMKTSTAYDWLFVDNRNYPMFIPPGVGVRIPRGKRREPEKVDEGEAAPVEVEEKKKEPKKKPKKAPFNEEFFEMPPMFNIEDFLQDLTSMQVD